MTEVEADKQPSSWQEDAFMTERDLLVARLENQRRTCSAT